MNTPAHRKREALQFWDRYGLPATLEASSQRAPAPGGEQGARAAGPVVRVYKIPRKPKGFRVQYPGHCVALDTVERHRDGLRRYLLTATDVYSR